MGGTTETLEELKERIIRTVLDQMDSHPDQHDIRVFINAKRYQLPGFMGSLGKDIYTDLCYQHDALRDKSIEHFILEVITDIHTLAVQRYRRSLFRMK